MKKAVFHVACLLPLLLSIASLLLWFRSYQTVDYLAYCSTDSEFGVASTIGRILIYSEEAIPPFQWNGDFGIRYAARLPPDSIDAYRMPNESHFGSVMGFGMMSGDNGRYRASTRFVPHWAMATVLAIPPLFWLRRHLRKKPDHGFQLVKRPPLAGENKNPAALNSQ